VYALYSVTADQANALSSACSGCVTDAMLASGISGGKVTSAVANATTAASFSGSLAGDVSGTQGATSVIRIQGIAVASAAPSSGQVLKFNGSQWAAGADANSGGTVTSVTASAPLSVATGTTTPAISLGVVPLANGGTGNTTGAVGGDLGGTLANATVTRIQNQSVAPGAPTDGNVLRYTASASQWIPVSPTHSHSLSVFKTALNWTSLNWNNSNGHTGGNPYTVCSPACPAGSLVIGGDCNVNSGPCTGGVSIEEAYSKSDQTYCCTAVGTNGIGVCNIDASALCLSSSTGNAP
jgi:hypothetical protein